VLIFISSTYVDLTHERLAAQEALRGAAAEPWGMEFFASEPSHPVDVALRELGDSDAVILIIGFYAGSLVPESPSTTYTLAEYDEATRLGRPVFVFIKTEGGSHQIKDLDSTKRRVFEEFLGRIQSAPQTPAYFSNIDELKYKVLLALTRWNEKGRPGARKTFSETIVPTAVSAHALFNFEQTLQGRNVELSLLNAFLDDPLKVVALLPGRGGIGKTKLLKSWTDGLNDWAPIWVSAAGTWHRETAKEIPSGNVLVIADDAHRYQCLGELIALVSGLSTGRKVKLVVGTRPSGISYVNDQLARLLDDTRVARFHPLEQLKLKDTIALAEEVLGPDYKEIARPLAEISKDTPLVTVVGGRLISRGQIRPAELANENAFRRTVFDRFIEDCEGQLATGGRPKRELLYLIAALQPISPSDTRFVSTAEKFLGLRSDQILQGINALEEAGVLIRAGQRIRIVPDVLGDYLLENACVNQRNETTGFAEVVFREFRDVFLSNLLKNLAELDWRISQREISSKLLLAIWEQLTNEFTAGGAELRSHLLKELKNIAPFQPKPMMALVRIAMDTKAKESKFYSWTISQEDVLSEVPEVLEGIALEPTLLADSVNRLWDLTHYGDRVRDQSKRALEGLVAYRRYKHVQFNERMTDLVTELTKKPDAFDSKFSPLDLVDELLDREVDHTELNGRTFTLTAFPLNYSNVRGIRNKALATIESLLFSNIPRASTRAVDSLERVLSGYLPKFRAELSPEERAWQNEERMHVLDIMERRIKAGDVPIPLARQIKSSLRGLIPSHTQNAVLITARALADELPDSDEMRMFDAICTGDWDRDLEFEDLQEASRHHDQQVDEAVQRLRVLYPYPKRQIEEVEALLNQATEFGISPNGGTSFLSKLCKHSDFLEEFSVSLLSENPSISYLGGISLCAWREIDRGRFFEFGLRFAKCKRMDMAHSCAIAICYGPALNEPCAEDAEILAQLAKRSEPVVLVRVLGGIARLGKVPKFHSAALQIALTVDLPEDAKVVDEYWGMFNAQGIDPNTLGEEITRKILNKVVPTRQLDEHNAGAFLHWVSSAYPELLAQFLLDRLEFYRKLKTKSESSGYQPIPHKSRWINFGGMRTTATYPKFLVRVRDKVAENSDERYWLMTLFWSVATVDEIVVGILSEWLQSGDKQKFDLLLDFLAEAPMGLAITNPDFAVQIVDVAVRFGPESENKAIARLVANSVSYEGVRTVGTVPLQFTQSQDKAAALAETFKPDSPGHHLFSRLASASKRQITDIQLEDSEEFPE
jgi:hypothetical protein